jgi:hypothetical protein
MQENPHAVVTIIVPGGAKTDTEFRPPKVILSLLPGLAHMRRTDTDPDAVYIQSISARVMRLVLRFAAEIYKRRLREAKNPDDSPPTLSLSLLPELPPPWQREFIRCHYELRGPDHINVLTIAAAILGFDELVRLCTWVLTTFASQQLTRIKAQPIAPRSSQYIAKSTLEDMFCFGRSIWSPRSSGSPLPEPV